MQLAQEAYIKASDTTALAHFSSAIAVSGDGSTLAVGAVLAPDGGAVYVFIHKGETWLQQALLVPSNLDPDDAFGGGGLALSDDGDTLVVGAHLEDGGVAMNPDDNSSLDAGAAYVFRRTGSDWGQTAYLKAGTIARADNFGAALALSGDARTLVISAPHDAIGGSAYVFASDGTTWTQQARLIASNGDFADDFGRAIALSPDGSTLAIGAPFEASKATGIGGDGSDNSLAFSGAAYVFTRTATAWSQQAYVKASNPDSLDDFGSAVSLSGDGNTLVVSAPGEASASAGDQADNSVSQAGAIYAFTRAGSTWSHDAYVKTTHPSQALLGIVLALSRDGGLLAAGAFDEASMAIGVDGDDADRSAPQSGATYLFARESGTWTQRHYLKASNTGIGDLFGNHVALSADGTLLAVGANNEDSAATGIDGDQSDNTALDSGAVYIFH